MHPDFADILILLIILGFIFGTIRYLKILKKDKPVIKLTIKTIEYNGNQYHWKFINNMYIEKQNDGDNNNYCVILEYTNDSKILISIDNLDRDIETIISEIGKYYWNWKRKENKNATK